MTKILLVEDNPLNQDMLSRRLAREGYEVAMAMDGPESLSKARTEKPDLILMDMNIPIIDGWEATRQLKADVQTKAIPVIALTAHAMVGDREKAIAAGCNDYATKPVEFKQLLATIQSFISVPLAISAPPAPVQSAVQISAKEQDLEKTPEDIPSTLLINSPDVQASRAFYRYGKCQWPRCRCRDCQGV